MARNRSNGRSQFPSTPQGVTQALGFFSGIDSTIERVGDWDIKTELFAEAVLGLVGAGYSCGFYTQWDGKAIVFRIYKGDGRDDHPIRDGAEFDRLMRAVLDRLAADRRSTIQMAE